MMDRIPKISLPAVAIIFMGLAASYISNLADPDYFWHLRAGQWMVENGHIPANDPFLWTQLNTPWKNHEWLSDVILFKVFKLGGGIGISVLTGALYACMLSFLYRFCVRLIPSFLALILTCLAGATVIFWVTGRPQSVTYLLFTYFLTTLMRYKDHDRTWLIWTLPPLVALWANLHGAYLIGIILIGMVAGLLSFQGLWDSKFRGWWKNFYAQKSLWYCMLLAIAAACLNPYGPDHLFYPFRVMSLWILPYIAEWQPTKFGLTMSAGFFVLIGLFGLTLTYGTSKPGFFDLGIPVVFIMLGLSQVRQIPLASIVLVAFIARISSADLPRYREYLKSQFLTSIGSSSKASSLATKEIGNVQYLVNWVILVAGLASTFAFLPTKEEKQRKTLNEIVGISAVEYLAKNPTTGPIFNEYGFGGYITWRLWPEQKAFIDGRSDMFSDQFSKDYFEIMHGKPNWEKVFDRYRFNTVIVAKVHPIRQLLLAHGQFREAFSDDKLTVLTRLSKP